MIHAERVSHAYFIEHIHHTLISPHSKLTHGLVQKVLRSGRVAESWLGATKEVAKRVSSTSVQGGLIDRNGTL